MTEIYTNQFMGLLPCSFEESDVVIVPVPYEKTVSYGKGTSGAPCAIIDASCELELFDEETLVDFETDVRIHMTEPILPDDESSVEEFLFSIKDRFSDYSDKFVIAIGGEHSITHGFVMGLAADPEKTTIVQIDAHADLIDSLYGQKWSHGTVMRRLYDEGCRLIQIGIRSCSKEEYILIEGNPRIDGYFAHELFDNWEQIIDTLSHLEGDVYLTFDVDGLDPSVIPSTGTPQPNGLNWNLTMEIFKTLFSNTRCYFMGADLVEYIPTPHPLCYDSIAAKLIAKMIGFWTVGRLR